MFERFTDQARRVVVVAQEQARLFDHGHIGTEHLLLAMLSPDLSGAAETLAAAGITQTAAHAKVEELVGRGAARSPSHIPFSASSKKVLESSLREALPLGHEHIGTQHLLLALLAEGKGTGLQVLQAVGADTAQLREAVNEGASKEPAPAKPDVAHQLNALEHQVRKLTAELAELRRRVEGAGW